MWYFIIYKILRYNRLPVHLVHFSQLQYSTHFYCCSSANSSGLPNFTNSNIASICLKLCIFKMSGTAKSGILLKWIWKNTCLIRFYQILGIDYYSNVSYKHAKRGKEKTNNVHSVKYCFHDKGFYLIDCQYLQLNAFTACTVDQLLTENYWTKYNF